MRSTTRPSSRWSTAVTASVGATLYRGTERLIARHAPPRRRSPRSPRGRSAGSSGRTCRPWWHTDRGRHADPLGARYSSPVEPRRRPFGIWMIVLLQLVNAVLAIVDVVAGHGLHRRQHPRMRAARASCCARSCSLGRAGRACRGVAALAEPARLGAHDAARRGQPGRPPRPCGCFDPATPSGSIMALNAATAFYLNSAAVRGLFLTRHEVTRISLGGRVVPVTDRRSRRRARADRPHGRRPVAAARVRADRPLQRGRALLPRRGGRATSRSATCSRVPPSGTARWWCRRGEVTKDAPGDLGGATGHLALPALRPGAAHRHRACAMADPPGSTPLPGARPARARGPVRAARGCRVQRLAAGTRHRARRHGGCRPGQVRGAARRADPRYVYHGRVVRRNGWIVLQYLFFHYMNDYRSTFNGANDHEADWEQVFIYLEERPDGPAPGLDRGRRPRLHRRPAAPALGRPDPGQGGRPPGDLRGRRLARELLRAGRVPHERAARGLQGPHQPDGRGPQLLGQHAPPARSRAIWRPGWRTRSRPRSWTTRGATGSRWGPARPRRGARSSSPTRTAGWTATAGCSAWTPTTDSVVSGRRPAPSTPGPAPSGCHGTTRLGFAGLDKAAPPVRWPEVLASAGGGAAGPAGRGGRTDRSGRRPAARGSPWRSRRSRPTAAWSGSTTSAPPS